MSSRRAVLVAAAPLVASLALGGCVPASPDADTYQQKTALTLGGALSEVSTVRDTLESLRRQETFRSSAITQLRYAESSLDTNAGAYSEVSPPPRLDWLYRRTDDLLTEAEGQLFRARLAIERHEDARYPAIANDLGKLADKLDKLETRVQ